MAKPTKNVRPLHVNEEDKRQAQLKEVEDLLIENKDTLKKTLDVLDLLDEHEVLNLMHASLNESDQVLTRVLHAIIDNDLTHSINNLLLLGELVGKLDMENVEKVALKVNQGVIDMASYENEAPARWSGIFSSLSDKYFIEGSNTLLSFIKAFGYTTDEIKKNQNIRQKVKTFTPKPTDNTLKKRASNTPTSSASSSKWIGAAVGLGALVSVSTLLFKK